jgi:hypothetical protein
VALPLARGTTHSHLGWDCHWPPAFDLPLLHGNRAFNGKQRCSPACCVSLCMSEHNITAACLARLLACVVLRGCPRDQVLERDGVYASGCVEGTAVFRCLHSRSLCARAFARPRLRASPLPLACLRERFVLRDIKAMSEKKRQELGRVLLGLPLHALRRQERGECLGASDAASSTSLFLGQREVVQDTVAAARATPMSFHRLQHRLHMHEKLHSSAQPAGVPFVQEGSSQRQQQASTTCGRRDIVGGPPGTLKAESNTNEI